MVIRLSDRAHRGGRRARSKSPSAFARRGEKSFDDDGGIHGVPEIEDRIAAYDATELGPLLGRGPRPGVRNAVPVREAVPVRSRRNCGFAVQAPTVIGGPDQPLA
jgi:hypothetical protein